MGTDIFNLSFNDFLSSNIADGEYRLLTQDSMLAIKLEGFHDREDTENFLVGFSGAISNRENTIPPYYSGLGIAKELGSPILTISDPTLDRATDCNLAWYLGNEDISDLPEYLRILIEIVAKKTKRLPIIFGGSGGGFISLALSSILTIKNKVLVWNPQTNVSKYFSRFVFKYLDVAYPVLMSKYKDSFLLAEDLISKQAILSDALSNVSKYYDLKRLSFSENSEIIYLQNSSDDHLRTHTIPFFLGRVWDRKNDNIFIHNDSIVLYIGSWGEGHIPPNKLLLKGILKQCIDGVKIPEITFEEGFNIKNISCKFNFQIEEKNDYLRYQILDIDNRKYFNVFYLATSGLEKVQYAFYFFKNQNRVETHWYDKTSIIAIPEGISAVQFFIKDATGKVLQRYVELK